jgi:hypothetical protein
MFVDVVFVAAVAVIVLLDMSSVELEGDVVIKDVLGCLYANTRTLLILSLGSSLLISIDKAKLIGDGTNIACVNSTAIPMLTHDFITIFGSGRPLVLLLALLLGPPNYKNVIFILIDDFP